MNTRYDPPPEGQPAATWNYLEARRLEALLHAEHEKVVALTRELHSLKGQQHD